MILTRHVGEFLDDGLANCGIPPSQENRVAGKSAALDNNAGGQIDCQVAEEISIS
jgi:hypothetical protein